MFGPLYTQLATHFGSSSPLLPSENLSWKQILQVQRKTALRKENQFYLGQHEDSLCKTFVPKLNFCIVLVVSEYELGGYGKSFVLTRLWENFFKKTLGVKRNHAMT